MPLSFNNNASLKPFQTVLASSDFTPTIKKLPSDKTYHGRRCASNNAGGGGAANNNSSSGGNTGRNGRGYTPINNGSKGSNNTTNKHGDNGGNNDDSILLPEITNIEENNTPHNYHPHDVHYQQLPYVVSSQPASVDENRVYDSGGKNPINFTAVLNATECMHLPQQSLDYDYLKGNNAVINPVQAHCYPLPVQPIDEVSGLKYIYQYPYLCYIIVARQFASIDR